MFTFGRNKSPNKTQRLYSSSGPSKYSKVKGVQGYGTSSSLLSNTISLIVEWTAEWTAEWTHPVDSSEVKVCFDLMPNGFSEKLSTIT